MKRTVAVAVALLVAGSVLAPAAFAGSVAAAQADDPEPVDGCTVIDESGSYEMTGDVGHDAAETCIEIRADDVVLDGNGHAIEGPGPDTSGDDDPYRGIFVNFSDGVEIRNVEVAGWSPGIRTDGSEVTVEDSVVRDGDVGIFLEETGPTTLSNVTVADNDGIGIDTHRTGDLQATDVTLEGNDIGLKTWDAHGLHVEDSRVVNNDGNGVNLHHHSDLALTDVTVSGNGGDGVEAVGTGGFQVFMTMDGGTVADNGGHGVAAIRSAHADLDGVSLEDNDGLELHGSQLADDAGRNVTATDLAVGPSATTTFESERLDLEPVDRDALPDLPDDKSAAGDGLNVSGVVDGPVDLTLDADDDNVDLRRHDGDGWETVAEDLDASDGTVEASDVENGTYAPVASDDGDGSDGTDDSDGDGDDTDGDTGGTGADDADGTSADEDDDSDTDTQTPSDQEKSKATPTESDDNYKSGSSTDGSGTEESTATDEPTATDDGTATASPTADGESTSSSDSDRQQAENETDGSTATDGDASANEGDDEGSAIGDGPGFGAIAAIVALLASALLAHRPH